MDIRHAIMDVLAYCAVLKYSPSILEIRRYLPIPATQSEVAEAAKQLVEQNHLLLEHGFYALPGHQVSMAAMQERYVASLRKLHAAKKTTRYLASLPDIEAVFLANSVSLMNAEHEADIDFIIVTKPKALWRARFFAVLPAALGRRRPGNKTADPHCYSFFITSANMDLRSFALAPEDPVLTMWAATFLPLHDPQRQLHALWEASGVYQAFPNLLRATERKAQPSWPRLGKLTQLVPVGFLEWLQKLLMPAPLRKAAESPEKNVIINHHVLKLHLTDRRAEMREKYLALRNQVWAQLAK